MKKYNNKHNCSECMNYMSWQKSIYGMRLNYVCGLGRLSVCKYFIPESQTD